MWKWLAIFIGCLLLLQACVSGSKEELKIQGKESVGMKKQLIQAAEKKDNETISQLIEKGADIDTQDAKGRTATMIATYNNDVETAKILIAAGADVNIQDDMKNNPFLYAGAEGYLEILKLTIAAGADPTITNRYGGTALIPAAEHGYVNVIQELLNQTDIEINHVNNLGWTALLEAIILNDGNEQQQTVQLLLDHGADVNIADHDNVTPLHHAKMKGLEDIEQMLIKKGAQ
ncbi:ankyrin repeat domain-containing protein [Peribacillus muralis]|uniref:ankyrin repeat domain-containing protein n=1 Tax=Peribacillus muralis TaxID=264697 RepID=UPI0009E8B5B5|nr:ankyrin repeat domain-containing protein [Peribacillus muralis]